MRPRGALKLGERNCPSSGARDFAHSPADVAFWQILLQVDRQLGSGQISHAGSIASYGLSYPQKITFGELRASGARDVLIYCRDHRCSHHVETNADGFCL